MHPLWKISLSILTLCGTQLALAGAHGGPGPDFASLDTDGDGRLSATELAAMPTRGGMTAEQRLQRLDADGDGYVTREELDQARARMGGPRPNFAALDTDGDGRLSREELAALPVRGQGSAEQRFSHLDQDGDGYVTREELGRMPPRGGRPMPPAAGGSEPPAAR